MPLLLLPPGTKRTTEDGKVPCMVPYTAWAHLQDSAHHHCWYNRYKSAGPIYGNTCANGPWFKVTGLPPHFLQLLQKVGPWPSKLNRQAAATQHTSSYTHHSSAPSITLFGSLSGPQILSRLLWKAFNCSYHWLGHDEEVLLQLVKQQVSTHHAV